jgi:hypothetical protein
MCGLFHPRGANGGAQRRKKAISRLIQGQVILQSLVTLAFVWVVVNLSYVYIVSHGAKQHRVESAFFILGFIILLRLVSGNAYSHGPDAFVLRDAEKAILVGAALICWLLIYLPFLKLPFLSDDYVFLMRLNDGHNIVPAEGFVRPIFNLAFFLLLRSFGYTALPFHAVGFSLHLGCSILVYFLLARIFRSFPPAFLGGLFFLLSPVQAEAVLWISGLQELLWVFFLLLAGLFYTGAREIGKKEIILASLFTVAALLSKETAVCFILFFLALDYLAFRFKRGSHLKWAYAAFLLILALFGFARAAASTIPQSFFAPPSQLFIKNFLSQPFKTFLTPWNQSYFGNLAALKFLVLAAGTLVLWLSSLKAKLSRDFLIGLALIYIAALPLYKMFYIAPDLQGSRYLYFSVFGWSVVIISVVRGLTRAKPAYITLIAVLLLGLSITLSGNLFVWGRAGWIIRALPENMTQEEAPDNFHGAYILRNGFEEFQILRPRIKELEKK